MVFPLISSFSGGSILFTLPDNVMEYHFFMRYCVYVLSLVDTDERNLAMVRRGPFEQMLSMTTAPTVASSTRSFFGLGAPSAPPPLHPRCGPQGPHSLTSIHQDVVFMFKMTQKCCLTLTSALGAVEYMLRLRAVNAVRLHKSTWRILWVLCIILSEKMWEDNFVHPQHIITMFNTSTHSKSDWMWLQAEALIRLDYDVNIKEQRFHDLLREVMFRPVPCVVVDAVGREFTTMGRSARGLDPARGVFVPRPLPQPPKIGHMTWSAPRLPSGPTSKGGERVARARVVSGTSVRRPAK
jgi:hypothetical protein